MLAHEGKGLNVYNYNPQGIGFAGLLTILFIGLRLLQVIDWSWWLVLSPLWIGFGVFLLLVAIVLLWQKR